MTDDYHLEMCEGVAFAHLSTHCAIGRHGERCDDANFWPEMKERSCKCHCHEAGNFTREEVTEPCT